MALDERLPRVLNLHSTTVQYIPTVHVAHRWFTMGTIDVRCFSVHCTGCHGRTVWATDCRWDPPPATEDHWRRLKCIGSHWSPITFNDLRRYPPYLTTIRRLHHLRAYYWIFHCPQALLSHPFSKTRASTLHITCIILVFIQEFLRTRSFDHAIHVATNTNQGLQSRTSLKKT